MVRFAGSEEKRTTLIRDIRRLVYGLWIGIAFAVGYIYLSRSNAEVLESFATIGEPSVAIADEGELDKRVNASPVIKNTKIPPKKSTN